jgi:predicted permease
LVNELLSILFIVLIGLFARKRGIVSKGEANVLNAIVMKLTLPALIFVSIVEADISWQFVKLVPLAFLLCALGGGAAFFLARLMKLSPPSTGSLMVAAMFCNSGFIGFPIAYQMFQESGLVRIMIFDLLGQNIPMFSVGLWIAAYFGQSDGETAFQDSLGALKQALLSPALLALVLGFLARPLNLPKVVFDTLQWFGGITIPLVVFSLGLSLDVSLKELRFGPILAAVGIQLFLAPLMAAWVGGWWKLDPMTYQIGILAAATPVAMGTLPIAFEYGLDEGLLSSLILVTTLLCVVTIPLMSSLLGVG